MSNTDLIIKLQKIVHGTIGHGIDIYKKLQLNGHADGSNVAHVVWLGEEYSYYAIVMPKYYVDLAQFFFFSPLTGVGSMVCLNVFAANMVSVRGTPFASPSPSPSASHSRFTP